LIDAHLPALLIVLPLMAGPIAVILRHKTAVWAWATAVSWIVLAMSWRLLNQVLEQGVVSYHLGGWEPPWGIEYRIDAANAYVLLLLTTVAAVVFPYARQSVADEVPEDRHHLFYAMLLLCLTGLMGMTITGDAFNVFVFLEISSLSMYGLIAMGRSPKALTASFRYLVLGTIGGTFVLIGIGLMYMATGTLNMIDLSVRLAEVGANRTVQTAFAFMTVGLSVKLAVFPLHIWLPNAYTYAPSAVTAFIAATATKVSFYVLLRTVYTVFGAELAFVELDLAQVLLPLAIVGIYVGSLVACFEPNVKRLLAYSSVAQVGYMVVGLSLANETALTGGIAHLFNHALMKGGLFLAVGCVAYRLGSVELDDWAGLGRRMPLTMAAFVIGGLSLIGVPLTVGFISKWYFVLGALEADKVWVAAALLGSSLIAVVYVWRVIEVAYFRPVPEGAVEIEEAPFWMLLCTWVLIGGTVVCGVATDVTVGVATRAAQALMAGGM
jgi:multicomponent Na+:H+ antiporter subunit D